MAYVTVTTDEGRITWRERVTAADFESDHFRGCLTERIGWGVADAAAIETGDVPTSLPDRRARTAEEAVAA
jgi:hypothetical protein